MNATPQRIGPNTFSSVEFDPRSDAKLPFDEFVETLLQKVRKIKTERFMFYEDLRRSDARWANGARGVLVLLGSIAFLLTALAAAIRLAPKDTWIKTFPDGDVTVMLVVLAIYAVMGTITFYEKGTDKSTAYFRHVLTIVRIRDLWTKFQFELLKELLALKSPSDPMAEFASRERIRSLAEAFCSDLNKATSAELTEFRTEFLTSLTDLDAAARKGSEDITKQIQETAAAAAKAAADAKAAAEKAAVDAKAAADAVKLGFLNLKVTGDFDEEIVIVVDGASEVRARGKTVAIERIPPGPRKILVRAKKGDKAMEASFIIDVKPGVQDVPVTLT
jgi:hypothetical protein